MLYILNLYKFFVSAIFQVPLAQNNPYAKVAHVGVACSATLHLYLLFPSIILERNTRNIKKNDTRTIKTLSSLIESCTRLLRIIDLVQGA